MEITGNNSTIYTDLLKLIQQGVPCVLATVTGTGGSVPQVPGSSAIIGEKGLITGTVGGGTVEHQVLQAGMNRLLNKIPEYFQFRLDHDISKQEEAICGGNMNILLDADPARYTEVFGQIQKSHQQRVHGILITEIRVEEKGNAEVSRSWYTCEMNTETLISSDQVAIEMFSNRKSGEFREILKSNPDNKTNTITLYETVCPLPRLLIAGAGHVGKAVSHLGRLLGFEVTVWDDRPDYACRENLPNADFIFSGHLNEIFNKTQITSDTYIVIVTRGHRNDSEVLKECIGTEAAYVGMIGSRNKIGQVREKFISSKWATAEEWAEIHSPIGLPVGSKTVNEIAVSIAAQLIMERSKRQFNG